MVVAFFRARHLHEAEPARSVGTPIPDDGHSVHLSISCIRVDPAHRTARADPGLLLAEFDRETQAFGLATTMGYLFHNGHCRADPRRGPRMADEQARARL